MTGRLVERSGARVGTVYPLTAEVTLIGRGDDCGVVVPSSHISRRHARVCWDGTRYTLEDLGSKNGTFVNGIRHVAPHVLRPGDVITLPARPDVALAFELSDETVTVEREAAPGEAIHIDTRTAEVWAHGRPVKVSAKGFLALALLAGRAGALVTKQELATGVWPEYGGAVSDDSIEQLISRLRRAIEHDPERPRLLLTVRGLGYRLVRQEAKGKRQED